MIRISLFFILFQLFSNHVFCQRILLFGHIKHFVSLNQIQEQMLQEIAREEIDYVFELGDSYRKKQNTFYKQIDELSQTYHVMGNHDIMASEINQLDYQAADVINVSEKWTILTINTSFGINAINKRLDELRGGMDNQQVIILGHHRIWDDQLFSPSAFQHDKSYKMTELNLTGINVKAIFAGNSGNQYMRDNPRYGLWIDFYNGIPCYNIGSGEKQHNGVTLATVDFEPNDFRVSYKKIYATPQEVVYKIDNSFVQKVKVLFKDETKKMTLLLVILLFIGAAVGYLMKRVKIFNN